MKLWKPNQDYHATLIQKSSRPEYSTSVAVNGIMETCQLNRTEANDNISRSDWSHSYEAKEIFLQFAVPQPRLPRHVNGTVIKLCREMQFCATSPLRKLLHQFDHDPNNSFTLVWNILGNNQHKRVLLEFMKWLFIFWKIDFIWNCTGRWNASKITTFSGDSDFFFSWSTIALETTQPVLIVGEEMLNLIAIVICQVVLDVLDWFPLWTVLTAS